VLEDDNTDNVESEGDEVVDMEGGGSCSRVLVLEDARDRVVDVMFNAGYSHLPSSTNELSVKII
jgi:hypothetical protein